jgi:hypothetical protein
MLGSGSIIVADDSVSIPHMALRTARFYHHESCGKCTPCREGTNWTVKMLERVVRGEATPMDLDIITSVQGNIIGHCLCVLGDSMAMPVSAMVNKFRDEFEEVIARAAINGLPTTEGFESNGDGFEPGPDGVGLEVLQRERLMGRPVPESAQAAEELPRG